MQKHQNQMGCGKHDCIERSCDTLLLSEGMSIDRQMDKQPLRSVREFVRAILAAPHQLDAMCEENRAFSAIATCDN